MVSAYTGRSVLVTVSFAGSSHSPRTEVYAATERVADLAGRVIAEGGDGDAWIVSADVAPTRYPFEAERELLEGTLRAAAHR